ncbi:MAG: hypothetical protein NZO16_04420 [Deltaproteobacteria bacterium]|nr:hypothetical protein [Deltaproteobacteria bacterium]
MKDSFNIPSPRKSLIVNFARLGDLLQTTPALAGLKQENPDNYTTLVTSTSFGEVTRYLPGVDEVELVDLDWIIKSLSHDLTKFREIYQQVENLIQKLKSKHFDFSANLSSMGASSILLKLINTPLIRGWISDSEGFRVLNSRWSRLLSSMLSGNNRHLNSFNVVDYFRMMMEVKKVPRSLVIVNEKECLIKGEELLKSIGVNVTDSFIVVHTGVSQMKRSWRAQHFANFIKKFIAKTGWSVLLTGSGNEVLLTDVLSREVNSPNCINLGGRTELSSLIGLIARAKAVLTGDTGPLHISAAVKTPSVSLFVASGWPYETGCYHEGQLVIRPVIACGPCSPNGTCSTLECHDFIDVDNLVELFLAFLDKDQESVRTISRQFFDCFVYQTKIGDDGFFDLEQLNDRYDPHTFLRYVYRKLILNDFENLGNLGTSMEFVDSSAKELFDLACHGARLTEELLKLLQTGSDNLIELSDKIESVDEKIFQIANQSESVALLARLYLFEKESIVGEVEELAQKTIENYKDLQNRIKKLNWLVQNFSSQKCSLSVAQV